MKQLPVLYSFRRCPYAIRARMSLIEAKVSVELREVVLKEKPQEMVEASAKGTVPVLLPSGDHGKVIDESLEIMLWALTQNNTQWLSGPVTLSNQLEIIADFEKSFKPLLDSYKYHDASKEFTLEYYRNNGMKVIEQLDIVLSTSAYLLGDRPRLLDVAVMPFIRQFAHVESGWFNDQEVPSLQNWLQGWLQSEKFSLAMRKYQVWKPDHKLTVFGLKGESR